MRKLLYSVCVLLIMNATALAQWDGWKNLKNPTFTTVTVTGAAIFEGTVTITGTVTMSQAMTSTSSITLTRATADTVRFMSAGGSFLEIEDNNVSLLDVEADGDFNFDVNTLFVDVGADAVGLNTITPLKRLDAAGSVRIKGAGTVTLTGTIDPTASATVDGVGTLFLTELVIGDQIVVTGENRTVTAIASNIELTVDAAFTDNANDTSPDKIESHLVITDSGGTTDLVVDADGRMGVKTASPTEDFEVGDGSAAPVMSLNKGGGSTAKLSFKDAGVEIWKIDATSGEALNITGVKSDEDFNIVINDGAVPTTVMTIDASEPFVSFLSVNVGIGTATPNTTLDVDGAITQETYVVRKHIALSGATDATATNFFTITTTDETGSADGGMYTVKIHLTAGEATAASGAVNTAAVGLLAHFTRIMASAGTGANTAVAEISETASADEGTGAISAVTLTVVETSEFVQTIQLDVNTSGGTFDGFALVELVYSDFTTPPVIAGI